MILLDRLFRRLLWGLMVMAALSEGVMAQADHAGFEARLAHPLALTPDGSRLLAVHAEAASLSVFDVTGGGLVRVAEIPVGLEPVAVRARTNDEVWVVNEVSDTVSVISLASGAVVAVLATGDEPGDVVFAGGKAFVSAARDNEIWVYDAVTRALLAQVAVEGLFPHSLAVSEDGARVFAAFLHSGNKTTVLKRQQAPAPPAPNNAALPAAPNTALIVAADDPRIPYTVVDHDVVELDVATHAVLRYVGGVGTNLLGLAQRPGAGELWVSNTEALNLVRFEPELNGNFVRNRLSKVALPTAEVTPHDLNAGFDYAVLPNPAAQAVALSQPGALVFAADGSHLWVAAFASDRVAKVDAASGTVVERVDLRMGGGDSDVMRGPRGLVLDEAGGRLFVLNKLRETLSVIDLAGAGPTVTAEVELSRYDPLPPAVKAGRGYLYDARLSGNGTVSCGICHLDGDRDGLAWDLGDPGGVMQTVLGANLSIHDLRLRPRSLHPMKGPMTTQTLWGMQAGAPFHWRGDKPGIEDFNSTFPNLMGGEEISEEDMAQLVAYLMTLRHHPNPNRNLDRSLPTWFGAGNPVNGRNLFNDHIKSHCVTCHALPTGSDNNLDLPQESGLSQPVKTPPLRTVYQRLFYDPRPGAVSLSGFGLLHDGTGFEMPIGHPYVLDDLNTLQELRDVSAFVMCFDTGTALTVGHTVLVDAGNRGQPEVLNRLSLLEARAQAGDCDLVVRGRWQGQSRSWRYQSGGIGYRGISLVNANGSLQVMSSPNLGVNGSISAMKLQADGKLLIAGSFTAYNGIACNNIARVNPDGSFDHSFNVGSGTDGGINALAVQSDGKVVIGGVFSRFNGSVRNRLARLNANGALDVSFDPGDGPNNAVNALVMQSDGKIVIGGAFERFAALNSSGVARVDGDGRFDQSFGLGFGANAAVSAVALQSDGKLILAGFFDRFDQTEVGHIVRLYENGSVDESFVSGSGANDSVLALSVQSDGKILVGGRFTRFNQTDRNKIVRLHQDGSIDTDFENVMELQGSVNALSVSTDGKMLVGGGSIFNGTKIQPFIRLGANGALDQSFDTTQVEWGLVSAFAVRTDGKFWVGESRAYRADRVGDGAMTRVALLSGLALGESVSFMGVLPGQGERLGGDLDGDEVLDGDDPDHRVYHGRPRLVRDLADRAASPGAMMRLEVAVLGEELVFEWSRNGVVLLEETGPILQRAETSLADAGLYQVRVSNGAGEVTSRQAVVQVFPAPSITVQPVARTVNQGQTASFSVTANGTGLSYQWLRGGLPVQGATARTLTFLNARGVEAGDYSVVVANGAGAVTSEVAGLTVVQPPVVTPGSLPPAMVGQAYSVPLQAANGATRFQVLGLPKGLNLVDGNRVIAGKSQRSGLFPLRVTAFNSAGSSGAAVTVNLEVRAFPAEATGVYEGGVEAHAGLNGDLGGWLRLVTSPVAVFTGQLRLGGRAHALRGSWVVEEGEEPRATVEIKRGRLESLWLELAIDEATRQLTGWVKEGEAVESRAAVEAAGALAVGAGYSGNHTLAMLVPEDREGVQEVPQGDGIGGFTVHANGAVRGVLRLADGTAVPLAAALLEGGEVRVFRALYGNLGSLAGVVKIVPSGSHRLAGSEMNWVKHAVPRSRSYAGGFERLALRVRGGLYEIPAAGATVAGLARAQLQFREGGAPQPEQRLDVADLIFPARHPARAAIPAGQPSGVFLVLQPRVGSRFVAGQTGSFAGGFTLKDADPTSATGVERVRKAKFQGMIVDAGDGPRGYGFFQLAELPSLGPPRTTLTNSPLRAGRVRLDPLPPP